MIDLYCLDHEQHLSMKRKLNDEDIPTPVVETSSRATHSDSFEKLGLDSRLLQAVSRAKFAYPTPVQARAIPVALEGKDILGMSEHHLVSDI